MQYLLPRFYIDGHEDTWISLPPDPTEHNYCTSNSLMVPCLDCHTLIPTGSRCSKCRKAKERNRPQRPAYRKAYNDPVYQMNRRYLLASAYTCKICGHLLGSQAKTFTAQTNHSCKPEVDHIIPLSQGGTNNLKNLQVVCRSCNQEKRQEDRRKALNSKNP